MYLKYVKLNNGAILSAFETSIVNPASELTAPT